MALTQQSWSNIAAGSCLVLLLVLNLRASHHWYARKRGRPLPPGPKRLPIVGNLFNSPDAWKPWLGFRDLTNEYGDIVYLEILGKPILILGAPSVMSEFLDKRSAISSSRALSPITYLSADQESIIGFMPYGEYWRRHRRVFWQHFHPNEVRKFWPVQQAAVRVLLSKLLATPSACQVLLRYAFTASVMKSIYGADVIDMEDKRIAIIEEVFLGLRECTISTQFLLEFLPILRYLPFWTPWIGKHMKALAASKEPSRHMIEDEFDEAKARIEQSHEGSCLVSQLLATHGGGEEDNQLEEQIARNVAANAAEAGADSTVSTMEGFFLAMCLYPEVQEKARADLDAIVGLHRLPDLSDRSSLVYIEAIVKESLRWHNVAPLAIPHITTADDELRGHFIPAGTTVAANVWACMHDPDIYPEPNKFIPERFIKDGKMDPDVLDPASLVFGFGRRICPGRYYADAGLFMLIASVLHVFKIYPPLDEHGNPVNLEHAQSDGLVSYPETFGCAVKPRSAEAEALILGLQREDVQ
ncbi:cytochrome P450 [Trametes coccinea BRFM310]|uniref:Cytochrome P450 n=1 Tax=Trametes coccinea (strain BRFM310) TaxID=1353009 RepID=A0A1Y2J1Z6_TRAC3|nr:cytochrome P450 [Trametes coccinea BRFM310]